MILDVYGRVSRLGDKRMRSVDGQVTDCTVRVEEFGAQVGEILKDPGRSAWNPKVKRPDWDTLMRRMETGVSGGVCVFDLSRFTRRPIEGERLIEAAESGLVVLDSEHEFDLTTADGKAAFRDQMKMAAYYSDRLSTTTRRGKRLKAMRGEPNGTSQRAFGFEPDALTQRVSEVEILRDAARRLLDGDGETPEPLDDVVTDLNARGVLTSAGPCPQHRAQAGRRCSWCGRKSAKGLGDGSWTSVTFKQMLLKPRNGGYIEHNDVNLGRLPGDPIFDPDTWERLTTLFASRRRGRPNSETYLCSGIATCGRCRHRLTGRPRKHMRPYPDGEVRRQYWCQPRVGSVSGCGRIAVDQREMDTHVGALAVTMLSSPDHAAQIEAAAKAAKVIDDKRVKLDAKIVAAEHTANELAGRLGRDEMSLERYDAVIGPLERRLVMMRAEMKELDEQRPPTPEDDERVSTASRAVWEARWKAATTSEKRSLLRKALRGRALVVGPVDVHAPRTFDRNRVTVEPLRTAS